MNSSSLNPPLHSAPHPSQNAAAPMKIDLRLARPDFALDVALALPARGITVLRGASGAGKTTLLRCVAGLERKAQGRIEFSNTVWQDSTRGIFLPTWQRPIGYVFQEASLFAHLSVRQNLEYGRKRRHASQPPLDRDRHQALDLDTIISLLGIEPLLERSTHALSGGERQRIAIARALATHPQWLLLDEPLAALDPARREEVLPWLENLRNELHIPMLYVTHSDSEMLRLADWVIELEQGVVREQGCLSDWQAHPALAGATPTPFSTAAPRQSTLVRGRLIERDTQRRLVLIQLLPPEESISPSLLDKPQSQPQAQIWVPDNDLPIGAQGTWCISVDSGTPAHLEKIHKSRRK